MCIRDSWVTFRQDLNPFRFAFQGSARKNTRREGPTPPAGILCPMISPRFLKLVDLFPLCPILTPEPLPAPFQIASGPEPV